MGRFFSSELAMQSDPFVLRDALFELVRNALNIEKHELIQFDFFPLFAFVTSQSYFCRFSFLQLHLGNYLVGRIYCKLFWGSCRSCRSFRSSTGNARSEGHANGQFWYIGERKALEVLLLGCCCHCCFGCL